MSLSALLVLGLAGQQAAELPIPKIAPGPFVGTLESLKQNRYPKWFTEGKLGIWAHWGPQSVPMEGDWYARQMYEQGSPKYQDHLTRYGHPSLHGYKDIIPLWRAEKWDPERLIGLYKKAGAKYFVSMGVHHDNFDLWNSTYHRWNAVKMGPKRDVVGTWQAAAKKAGLHFGVSEHLGASFTWFQGSHLSDKSGPMAGVPYDGANPAYEDLYHQPAWPGDKGWYSNDPRWHAEWFQRIKDLVDQYHPDLLYSDGGIPFGSVGQSLVAHLYNTSMAVHHGRQEAVYTCKQPSEGRWAQDVERGVLKGILPEPWQTDTSIGDWFYNKHWQYRDAAWVIRTLVDVVSKNGNLLINVVQKPDGSLDPQAEKVLADMAAWMKVNGESIYGTKPWLVHGEGPVRANGGAFGEDFAYSERDVRFTTKGDGVLYATLMGWPSSGEATIRSLASLPGVTGKIESVRLLGANGKVEFSQSADGLKVKLPGAKTSDFGVVLKITGRDLRGFKPTDPNLALVVNPNAAGMYTLDPGNAMTHGSVNTETRDGIANIGFWDNAADWVSWSVDFRNTDLYTVYLTYALPAQETQIALSLGDQTISKTLPATGDWGRFTEVSLGQISLPKGKQTVALRPADAAHWMAMNVRSIRLVQRSHFGE